MNGSATFHTTRWTLVRQSRLGDPVSCQALSDLCAAYYAPVVSFIARCGFEESRARDLAHDFFARLLGSPEMLNPNRERGRFRAYLLGCVKHFVADTLDRERAAKRGGGTEMVHLTESGLMITDGGILSPDRAFDQQWALTVVDRVLGQLTQELEREGKAQHFVLLKPWLTGDEGEATQAEIADALSMNEGAVKVAIHRLRKRFRTLIKEEIAHTVGDEMEARDELTHLLAAM